MRILFICVKHRHPLTVGCPFRVLIHRPKERGLQWLEPALEHVSREIVGCIAGAIFVQQALPLDRLQNMMLPKRPSVLATGPVVSIISKAARLRVAEPASGQLGCWAVPHENLVSIRANSWEIVWESDGSCPEAACSPEEWAHACQCQARPLVSRSRVEKRFLTSVRTVNRTSLRLSRLGRRGNVFNVLAVDRFDRSSLLAYV